MDQSEIDALLAQSGKSAKGGKKGKDAEAAATPAPAPAEAQAAAPEPAPEPAAIEGPRPDPTPQTPQADKSAHVISELDQVTQTTERESNKIMDHLDRIGQLVTRQQQFLTELLKHEAAQTPAVQQAIHQVASAGKEIQDCAFDAMDLMQFQDITRQKLERIVYHLRQIHDYIVDLLGTGLKSEGERASISRTIASTSTRADENKAHADAVVQEFLAKQKKG